MQEMYRVRLLVVVATLVLAAGWSATASAQASDKLQVAAKLGLGVAPTYEGSDDYEGVPLWVLRADNLYAPDTYVQLRNTTLTSNLLPNTNFRLGPMVQYIPTRDNVSDSVVNRMQHVDASLMVGGLIGYDFKLSDRQMLGVEFQGRQDVESGNGYLLTLLGRYRAPLLTALTFNGELSSTYASSDYMESYFGVSAANAARSGLDQFNADSGIKDVTLNLGLDYALFDGFSLGFSAAYSRLLNDAKDSPIVSDRGDENQFFAGLTAGYRF
jgi:MipA family protein